MKRELEDLYGISTRSLFEKSEFVRALAEARVDGVSSSSSSSNNADRPTNNEGYAEYKDVEVLTDDSSGPRPKGLDPKAQQQQPQQVQEPMNPFAGMGNMGGMGGLANLFKTMGGGGNASPFGSGGGGGNPSFGNAGSTGNMMGRVQEMMSNPKVMAIMRKAQSNPRIMAKVQECMSNPTAILKYQNDPDVAELIRELRPYIK